MANNNDSKKTAYVFPSNVNVVETSDPKQILGKYLYEPMIKTWEEDFIDEDTGEIVNVERSEIIMQRGTYIDQDCLQKVMFSIQAGEVSTVKVCDEFILQRNKDIAQPYEVTLTGQVEGTARVWVGSCHSPEEAAKIVSDWCAIYCPDTLCGQFMVCDTTTSAFQIIDDNKVVTDGLIEWKEANVSAENESGLGDDTIYWCVTLRRMYKEMSEWQKHIHKLIVRAWSGDNAANIVMTWAKKTFISDEDRTLFLIESVKRSRVTDVIPMQYRREWEEQKAKRQEGKEAVL